MKFTRISFFAFLLCATFVFSACKKDPITSKGGGDGSKVAANSNRYMRADLNGVSWEADFVQSFANAPGAQFGTGKYTIYGELNNGDYFQLYVQDLTGQSIGTQSYDLGEVSSTYAFSGVYHQGANSWFVGNGVRPGYFTISEISGSKTKASFEMIFSSNASAGDTLIVSNGEFATDNFTTL